MRRRAALTMVSLVIMLVSPLFPEITHARAQEDATEILAQELLRELALERLHQMGLPARRDKYWRFTCPEALIAAQAAPVPLMVDEDAPNSGKSTA
ncbi:MAG: hypothetical protein Q9M41_11615 [Paracoccaceae bacterium]|nr:hypothetical protein [Paracoccaceae bacterium]